MPRNDVKIAQLKEKGSVSNRKIAEMLDSYVRILRWYCKDPDS